MKLPHPCDRIVTDYDRKTKIYTCKSQLKNTPSKRTHIDNFFGDLGDAKSVDSFAISDLAYGLYGVYGLYARSPRMRRANWMSFGMMVTRLA